MKITTQVADFNSEWFQRMVERSKSSRFTVTGVVITPSLASTMTERNVQNRHLIDNHVRRLAADMQYGRWEENGETIKFDTDGRLNDGQHRLYAAALYEQTFTSDICFGLSSSSRLTVDQGRKRTARDILQIRDGTPNAAHVASAVRVLLTLRAVDAAGRNRVGPSFTSIEVAAHFDDFPNISEYVTRAMAFHRTLKRPSCGVIAALMFMFDNVAADASERFWRMLETGLDMHSDEDPIYVLRERLTAWANSRARQIDYDALAVVIKAWNAYRKGKSIRVLHFKPDNEKFPVIE